MYPCPFASSCPRLPGCAAEPQPRNVNEGFFAATDILSLRQEVDNETWSWVGTEIGRDVARYQLASRSISVRKVGSSLSAVESQAECC